MQSKRRLLACYCWKNQRRAEGAAKKHKAPKAEKHFRPHFRLFCSQYLGKLQPKLTKHSFLKFAS